MPLPIEASAIDALQLLVCMFMDSFRMSLITGDRARSSSPVLTVNNSYGAWLTPLSILDARLFKVRDGEVPEPASKVPDIH
jgi:hypothetical protein